MLKFWLNVSRDEQRRRFLRRIRREDKNWKFRLGDLDDRERWPDFMHAYEEMLRATSRAWAPWYAIPADDKPYMRFAVARAVLHALKGLDLAYPEVSREQKEELDAGRRRLEGEGGP